MAASSSLLYFGGRQESATDYEASFRVDVLCLTADEAEETLDEALMNEAKEMGVVIDLSPQLKPLSTRTYSSDPTRRSASIYSTNSRSTGLTSNLSEISREQQLNFNGKRNSRASLSLRDYDSFLARGKMDERRTSLSFSPPSTPALSTFSLPLYAPEAAPRKHFRMIRGLSMLKLHRSDVSSSTNGGCPHCPGDALSQRRAMHKLSCGHRLCTPALRNMIKNATGSKTGAVPSCCGVPIPSTLIQIVITQEEQDILLVKLEQWDEAISLTPSITSDVTHLATEERPSPGNRKLSTQSKVDSVAPPNESNIEILQGRDDFKQLQSQQTALRARYLPWAETQRSKLTTSHERHRADMATRHENSEEDLIERHTTAMSEAEDKQVKAEADMRYAHAQEKRDQATALKHMEAYCAGTYSTGEAHNRIITEQDRAELEKARRIRDGMDTKHDNAINVLRGEQSRRMRLRQQRQDKEVQELRRAQRKEELEFERACTSEVQRFDEFAAEKRRRVSGRWELQNKIFVRRVEVEMGVAFVGRLPLVELLVEDLREGLVGASGKMVVGGGGGGGSCCAVGESVAR